MENPLNSPPLCLINKRTGRLYMLVRRTRLEKAQRDLSKLARKVIIDKNGHKRTVYVRTGPPVKKDGKARKAMLQDFINESLKDRKAPYKWVRIGTVGNDAQKRIEQKCGAKVSEIHIDNSGIIHAMGKPQHNLEPDDLLHAVDVINTTNDINLSEKKHKSNEVLIFKQDINGDITFLAEVHVKNDYLLIFDAWRQKKARRDPDAAKRPPGAYVRNESPSAT